MTGVSELRQVTGRAALVLMRAVLKMPSADARRWDAMTAGERAYLIRAAGLPESVKRRTWEEIRPVHRAALLAAIKRAADWARSIEGARP